MSKKQAKHKETAAKRAAHDEPLFQSLLTAAGFARDEALEEQILNKNGQLRVYLTQAQVDYLAEMAEAIRSQGVGPIAMMSRRFDIAPSALNRRLSSGTVPKQVAAKASGTRSLDGLSDDLRKLADLLPVIADYKAKLETLERTKERILARIKNV